METNGYAVAEPVDEAEAEEAEAEADESEAEAGVNELNVFLAFDNKSIASRTSVINAVINAFSLSSILEKIIAIACSKAARRGLIELMNDPILVGLGGSAPKTVVPGIIVSNRTLMVSKRGFTCCSIVASLDLTEAKVEFIYETIGSPHQMKSINCSLVIHILDLIYRFYCCNRINELRAILILLANV